MGQVATSKQRTSHPLASPSDKVGAKEGKPGGPECTRPPFGRTVQVARGQTKVPGHSGGFLQALPRGNRASPEAEASLRQSSGFSRGPRGAPGYEARPGGPVWPPPPPRLHGNGRPRPGCSRLGPAGFPGRPRMPGLLLGPARFSAPLSAKPAVGPGPTARADHPRPREAPRGWGHERGELKAQFTCCYRCETSLDAPRMSRGPPQPRPDYNSHQRRRGPFRVPWRKSRRLPAFGAPHRPRPPATPPSALDPRVFAALEQGPPSLGFAVAAQGSRPRATNPRRDPPPPPPPKPGPMAAGRGGTSVRVKRRGRARGGLWGLRGGECEPLGSHRGFASGLRAGGPSGRLRARPAPPAASELTGLESGLSRERNPSRSSPRLPPAFFAAARCHASSSFPSPSPHPASDLVSSGR